uniref:Trichohyalin-plectin-homology domain-containing protein n=1 Tax=Zooxanthella nutricula TaxID=1333877 RepID=A0A7S2PN61_9DINO|mmetsp:Transcript_62770/g.191999  ORF Transcript_62770/g.191999 Transcript_62770/m.191999 type:complete len:331 (+) Transcript_62770:170-1162(+)
MANDLDVQIGLKKGQKQENADQEKKMYEIMEADLAQWKKKQGNCESEARQKALQMSKEREEQTHEMQRRKDMEAKAKFDEDKAAVERAKRELVDETNRNQAKKEAARAHQKLLMQESKSNQSDPRAAREAKIQEERRKVEEFTQMLDEQAQRNRQPVLPIRGADVQPVRGGRRGQEFYSEENVAKQLIKANQLAETKEREKHQSKKQAQCETQDFLFRQMADRNKQQEVALEQKNNLKIQAQAETREFQDSESRRLQLERRKNQEYRAALDLQVEAKKAAKKNKQDEDRLTAPEKAINRKLITEAQELLRKMPGASPRAAAGAAQAQAAA